jgi:hypothetical protein
MAHQLAESQQLLNHKLILVLASNWRGMGGDCHGVNHDKANDGRNMSFGSALSGTDLA